MALLIKKTNLIYLNWVFIILIIITKFVFRTMILHEVINHVLKAIFLVTLWKQPDNKNSWILRRRYNNAVKSVDNTAGCISTEYSGKLYKKLIIMVHYWIWAGKNTVSQFSHIVKHRSNSSRKPFSVNLKGGERMVTRTLREDLLAVWVYLALRAAHLGTDTPGRYSGMK